MFSEFNNFISNYGTPQLDLSQSGAFDSLDDRYTISPDDPESMINSIEIKHRARISLDDFKDRQKKFLKRKKQAETDSEANMGPLQREAKKDKKPVHNHKRVSQISIIDEFYTQNNEA